MDAMSVPSPRSGHGCISDMTSSAWASFPLCINGVKMRPGQMALTRMRWGASSSPVVCARLITAALAAEYACGPAPPPTPAIDAVLMMDPPVPCGIMTRAACLVPSITERTRMAKVSSQASASSSVIGPNAPPMPALLNTTSSCPKASTASSVIAATSSSTATSVRVKRARSLRPAPVSSSMNACPASALRSPITTEAPSARNSSTVDRPMPLAPPVITAALPASRPPELPLLSLIVLSSPAVE